MGIINKIRQRTGLAVGIVALGLILFLIGGDLLSVNSIFLSGDRNLVGEIRGERVLVDDYRAMIQEVTTNYVGNTGKQPDSETMRLLRDQAWQRLLIDISYQQEYAALGLTISEAEIIDMVQGDHIRPDIKAAFKDSDTGEFDRDRLLDFLKELSNRPEQEQYRWYVYEKRIGPERTLQKYTNLISKTNYVSESEASWWYDLKKKSLDLRYMYIPYSALFDSLFTVSDADTEAYLDAHKHVFEAERSCALMYVRFPTIPSEEDSLLSIEDLASIASGFRDTEEDSLFAALNTEGDDVYRSYKRDELPSVLPVDLLVIGEVLGPYLVEGSHHLYKVSDTVRGSEEYVRARHILIKGSDASSRKEAEKILREARAGLPFDSLAAVYSMDGSASKGGDLGWFGRGKMVTPFEDAVFEAKENGLIHRLIETRFGFHLIDVTATASDMTYTLSRITQKVRAGDQTKDNVYSRASAFSRYVRNSSMEFKIAAEKDSLEVGEDKEVFPQDYQIGDLQNVRNIVQWAYNSGKKGSTSDVFETEEAYVVAHMIDEQPKGLQRLHLAEESLKEKILVEKKGDFILSQIDSLDKLGGLDAMAEAYGRNAYVYSADKITIRSNSLRSAGDCPDAIGYFLTLKEGEISKPMRSETGIILAQVVKIEGIEEEKDQSDEELLGEENEEVSYEAEKQELERARGNVSLLHDALKYFSKVKDKRYKYF